MGQMEYWQCRSSHHQTQIRAQERELAEEEAVPVELGTVSVVSILIADVTYRPMVQEGEQDVLKNIRTNAIDVRLIERAICTHILDTHTVITYSDRPS